MNFFDPKGFAAGGFLDGQVADIVSIKATKFDYNGTVDPPANVIEIGLVRADGKTRTEVYGTGAAEPSEDGNGITKSLNNQSKAAALFNALGKTKFPVATLAADKEGLAALAGKRFTWKNIGKGGKDIFVPETYHGVAEGEASSTQAQADEVKELVGTLILSFVKAGEVKKNQLPARVGKALEASPDLKPQALSLVMNDSFLSSIAGVNFDKGVLSAIEG